jgi:hypothetical protein
MKIEIEDRCHCESTLVVTITTPKDGMMYDDEVVQRSVKHLVDKLSGHTSSGFTHALEEALRKRHDPLYEMVVE